MRMMAGRVDKPLQVFYRNQSYTREITFPSNFGASPTKSKLKHKIVQNYMRLNVKFQQIDVRKVFIDASPKTPVNIWPKIFKFESY